MSEPQESRVLIIAPVGQDAEAMAGMLKAQGIPSGVYAEPRECLKHIGTGAGTLLLTEEVLEMPGVDELLAHLKAQPAWSELPVIILTSGGESRLVSLLELAASAAGSVILLERPMSPGTLLRSVQAALRSRQRQYQVRDLMAEQKMAEEALRESGERFRVMADGTPIIIWAHSAEGGLQFTNRTYREFFGVTAEQVQGGNWMPLVHPEDQAGYLDVFLECHRQRKGFHAQARVRRHDGQWRWIESHGEPRFTDSGEFRGMVGSSLDITERKEFQEELERLVAERTAKLQEVVGELEHFSYSITHDMRAPLRAMMGFAAVVEELSADSPNHEQKDFLRRISISARRMDLLITDALNYSKTVRSELPLAPVDVGHLLRGMLDTYPELQAARRGISVERDLPLVIGNEAGLTQCFSNLLGNAVKFAKPGSSPEIQVRAQQFNGWVRLWVEDKGVGISKAMLPKVFQMFSRGASEQAGTGIGLALVRKVVDRMGGRVGVESEEGKGSRFWVELRPGDVRQAPAAERIGMRPKSFDSGGQVIA